MDLSNILAISGKPDLNELISRTKNGAIVKNIVTGVKFPVFTTNSISQLSEIRMFTTSEERPLKEIFENAYKVLGGKATDFDPKKADNTTLFEMLAKVLPDYDAERVHASDAKKLFQWYNILLNAGILTPTEQEQAPAEEKPAAKKPAAKKAAAPNATAARKAAAPNATTHTKAAPKRTTTAKKAI